MIDINMDRASRLKNQTNQQGYNLSKSAKQMYGFVRDDHLSIGYKNLRQKAVGRR